MGHPGLALLPVSDGGGGGWQGEGRPAGHGEPWGTWGNRMRAEVVRGQVGNSVSMQRGKRQGRNRPPRTSLVSERW